MHADETKPRACIDLKVLVMAHFDQFACLFFAFFIFTMLHNSSGNTFITDGGKLFGFMTTDSHESCLL